MDKYTLVTWPDSQQYIGNPKCHPVSAPENKSYGAANLNAAYLVPLSMRKRSSGEMVYVRTTFPESQKFSGMEDDQDRILLDTEGATYVENTLYEQLKGPSAGKISLTVTFSPSTRLVITVPKGKTLDDIKNDDFLTASIIRAARRKILNNPGDFITRETLTDITPDTDNPAEEDEKAIIL